MQNNQISKNLDTKALVQEVVDDFLTRQADRRGYDCQWQLNINFLMGNQYCGIVNGEIVADEKQFRWQEREVYNHIAPLIETRLSRLSRVRPKALVRPYSSKEEDIASAKLSNNILTAIQEEKNIGDKISSATMWSEICGTSFYKVTWNQEAGRLLGKRGSKYIYEGDCDVTVCSPFEIYPDSNTAEGLEEVQSIIHAKALHVDKIQEIWGVQVQGQDLDVFTLESVGTSGYAMSYGIPKIGKTVKKDHAIVIEKYIKPSKAYPNGRLIIVAGDTLLFDGVLPYINESFQERGFPFIMQRANKVPGCFWGISIVERTIPIQRAYNTVKNRKNEFLNRLSMGIVRVEDGSVDTDLLEEGGLTPGSVIVYRQGSTPPTMMDTGSLPFELTQEENRLLNEFTLISGVSDLMKNSYVPSNVTSGVALQLLIEQDDARLGVTADEIKKAFKLLCQHILRMYKQFSPGSRLIKYADFSGDVQVNYFTGSDITSDDVVFDTENEINDTPAQRRNMVFELLNTGLFNDDTGRIPMDTKRRLIDMIGLSSIETAQDLTELHMARAKRENADLQYKMVSVSEIDDHAIHIAEHKRYALAKENIDAKIVNHINEHKMMQMLEMQRNLAQSTPESFSANNE